MFPGEEHEGDTPPSSSLWVFHKPLPPPPTALGSSQSIEGGGRPAGPTRWDLPSRGTKSPARPAPLGALSRVSWTTGWSSPMFSKPTGPPAQPHPPRTSCNVYATPLLSQRAPNSKQVGCRGRGCGCYFLAPSETATPTPRTSVLKAPASDLMVTMVTTAALVPTHARLTGGPSSGAWPTLRSPASDTPLLLRGSHTRTGLTAAPPSSLPQAGRVRV